MSAQTGVNQEALDRQRLEVVRQWEEWTEIPLLLLGLAWLALLIIELIWGLSPILEALGTVIWVLFIADFAVRFVLAPRKLAYLRSNWLTAIALVIPALRLLRVARLAPLFRAARTLRGMRLLRVVTSLNRGMKALGASLRRRGFGYVTALTVVVALAGAAGMYALENEGRPLFNSYGEALWWTAMLLTTMGSDVWPRTGEGRVLCLILALYAFAVFGYITATLATFFIDRDAEDSSAEIAGAQSIEALRAEIAALRAEIRDLLARREELVDR